MYFEIFTIRKKISLSTYRILQQTRLSGLKQYFNQTLFQLLFENTVNALGSTSLRIFYYLPSKAHISTYLFVIIKLLVVS